MVACCHCLLRFNNTIEEDEGALPLFSFSQTQRKK